MTTVAAGPCVHEFDEADPGRRPQWYDEQPRCSLCYGQRCPDCYGYGQRLDGMREPISPTCGACQGRGVDPAEDDAISQRTLF